MMSAHDSGDMNCEDDDTKDTKRLARHIPGHLKVPSQDVSESAK